MDIYGPLVAVLSLILTAIGLGFTFGIAVKGHHTEDDRRQPQNPGYSNLSGQSSHDGPTDET